MRRALIAATLLVPAHREIDRFADRSLTGIGPWTAP
jgi:hypothetical protein